jgi:hypothetical protein
MSTLTQIQLPQSDAFIVLEDCHGNTVTNMAAALDISFSITAPSCASLPAPAALPTVEVSPQSLTIGDGTGRFAVDHIQVHGGSGAGVCDMVITVSASGQAASGTVLPHHMLHKLPVVSPLRLTFVFAPADSSIGTAALQRLDRLERVQQSVVATKKQLSVLAAELEKSQKYIQQKEWTMGIAVEDQLANQVTVSSPLRTWTGWFWCTNSLSSTGPDSKEH